MTDAGRDGERRLSARALPLAYLAFAYLCLGLASAALMLMPRLVGGFFYHPKMLAVVHLVTLGWVTASILGYFYLVAPLALRTVQQAGRSDVAAFALVVIGVAGMVAHFWIDEYAGMVWSASTLWAGLAIAAWRALDTSRRARVPFGVKVHLVLAFLNLLAAGALGILIGLEKQLVHVLPGYLLYNVYLHAHLAALGWATMMVMGLGYRLLPMVLPSAMPKGHRTWRSAALVQAGLVALLFGFPASSRAAIAGGALLAAAGVLSFLRQVMWMLHRPRPAPADLRRPDLGSLHAQQALAYLLLTVLLGVALALTPPGAWKIPAATVYGVMGLVGFLAQVVVGMAARILPMFAWTQAYVGGDFVIPPVSQYRMHSRALQAVGLVLWTASVPALAVGLAFDGWWLLSSAGAGLLAALACNAINSARIARHAFPRAVT